LQTKIDVDPSLFIYVEVSGNVCIEKKVKGNIWTGVSGELRSV